MLNGLAFILIGLQLPRILSGLSGTSTSDLPFLIPRVRNRERFPPWQNVTQTAWSGMYGAVSLAAALMRGYYTKRRKTVETRFGLVPVDETPGRYVLAEENVLADDRVRHDSMRRLKLELISAERTEVVTLRNQGEISDDVMHRIEHDLDLEDLRLAEAPA